MKTRNRTTIYGHEFTVPQHIVRLDGDRVHGWQLRFGEWKLFSDFTADGSGAEQSLEKAKAELAERLSKLPAPTGMRTDVLNRKTSGLPLGVSPSERRKKGKNVLEFYYQVTYPVFGAKSANKRVYIATENTLTHEKQRQALSKAVAMRKEGERLFREAKRRAQQQEAVGLKASLADA